MLSLELEEASCFIFSSGFDSDTWSNFSIVRLLAFHLFHGFLNISKIYSREKLVKKSWCETMSGFGMPRLKKYYRKCVLFPSADTVCRNILV